MVGLGHLGGACPSAPAAQGRVHRALLEQAALATQYLVCRKLPMFSAVSKMKIIKATGGKFKENVNQGCSFRKEQILIHMNIPIFILDITFTLKL